jgi:hypothetical protein
VYNRANPVEYSEKWDKHRSNPRVYDRKGESPGFSILRDRI